LTYILYIEYKEPKTAINPMNTTIKAHTLRLITNNFFAF